MEEVYNGGTVIFTERHDMGSTQIGRTSEIDSEIGHTKIIDQILTDETGRNIAIGFIDPSGDCMENGRGYLSPQQVVFIQENSPLKIDKSVIVFQPKQLKSENEFVQLSLPVLNEEPNLEILVTLQV
jgi:hypothetical protein